MKSIRFQRKIPRLGAYAFPFRVSACVYPSDTGDVVDQGVEIKMIFRRVRSFIGCDSGVTAVEYALISALVAIVIIFSVGVMGDALDAMFQDPAAAMDTVANNGGGS